MQQIVILLVINSP